MPLIDGANEPVIRLSIQTRCRSENAILQAVGIMPDRAHFAASVPPGISLSALIGRLEGASTHAADALDGLRPSYFAGQAEYGIFSSTEKSLPDVVAYVTNQRHVARDLWPTFEDPESP